MRSPNQIKGLALGLGQFAAIGHAEAKAHVRVFDLSEAGEPISFQ
jgi:hypothetical protein